MLSQLGPLFKTTFRQAESNDTRQAIPHDERDQRRKKKEEERPKEQHSDFWEDNTSVSVGALRIFLIDFLKTMPGATDTAARAAPQTAADDHIEATSQNPAQPQSANARAAEAYQSTARHVHEATTMPKPPADKEKPNNEPTADKLQSKEIRDIHTLISELEDLNRRGVHDLHIERADSFLESLKNAVQASKSRF